MILELKEEGFTGLGEASPVSRYNESPDKVEAFLRKIDHNCLCVNDIVSSNAHLDGIQPDSVSARCAVDVALLDLAAKFDRKSLHEFLGFRFKEGLYMTSFTISLDTPRGIRERVKAAADYSYLKLKVGDPSDKANLKLLREIAPNKPVRVDANEAWTTKEEALRNLDWLATDHNIQFVEQPMPAITSDADWIWLKERSPLPIFADESYHADLDAERAAQCFHGVNVKLAKTGGVHGAIRALQAARTRGLKTMLGCMVESSVLISAAAHLVELSDFQDLDGNLLVLNDPYLGMTVNRGALSFATAPEKFGLRVSKR